MAYGLTAEGFLPKSLTVIREELVSAARTAFGNSIDTGDKSILGQLIGILAEAIYKVWEQLEAVHSSQDPNKATGAGLDAVSAITGTYRPPASFSSVVMTLFGVPGTPVATGTRFTVTGTEKAFATAEDVTIVAAPAWAALTNYAEGDRVFSDTDKIYQCIVAGVSHAATPVSGTGNDITDGTVHWKLIGEGLNDDGVVDATSLATETGPITATAGDIVTIATPVFGLQSAVNLLDANQGRKVASDEELRILRELELAGEGQSPANAIRADVLKIPGVLTCTVFQNLTDYVDADGMPPHAVEVLVRTTWAPGDDDDQLIFDLLQRNVAAGIVTHGNVTGSALDSEGTTHVMKFSRPVEREIYVDLEVTVDISTFPADGTDLVKDAIVAWGDRQPSGKDAVSWRIGAAAADVDGVNDVTQCFIDDAPAPSSSANVAISRRELAMYDTSRITVTATPGEP